MLRLDLLLCSSLTATQVIVMVAMRMVFGRGSSEYRTGTGPRTLGTSHHTSRIARQSLLQASNRTPNEIQNHEGHQHAHPRRKKGKGNGIDPSIVASCAICFVTVGPRILAIIRISFQPTNLPDIVVQSEGNRKDRRGECVGPNATVKPRFNPCQIVFVPLIRDQEQRKKRKGTIEEGPTLDAELEHPSLKGTRRLIADVAPQIIQIRGCHPRGQEPWNGKKYIRHRHGQ